MNFNLKVPCANCPFRKGIATNYGWLGKGRAIEIAESLKEWAFPCHKTTNASNQSLVKNNIVMELWF